MLELNQSTFVLFFFFSLSLFFFQGERENAAVQKLSNLIAS
jgi:hypothetical protein